MKADNMQIQVQEFNKKVEQVFIWTYQCAVWGGFERTIFDEFASVPT